MHALFAGVDWQDGLFRDGREAWQLHIHAADSKDDIPSVLTS
jgi:hypothetical protein